MMVTELHMLCNSVVVVHIEDKGISVEVAGLDVGEMKESIECVGKRFSLATSVIPIRLHK